MLPGAVPHLDVLIGGEAVELVEQLQHRALHLTVPRHLRRHTAAIWAAYSMSSTRCLLNHQNKLEHEKLVRRCPYCPSSAWACSM